MRNGFRSSPHGTRLVRFFFLAVVFLTGSMPDLSFAQTALTNGANHAAAIASPGEIDEFTFTASIGDAIALSIGEVLPGGPDPDFRPWIRLRRPDGMEIGSDIGALAAQIYTTAPLSGEYTVLVRDSTVNRPGTALGAYVLYFVRVPGALSIPDEGGALTNGGNHAGTIQLADLDPWTFTAGLGDGIVVTIGEVLDSDVDPDFLPWIRLYGPTGSLLASDAGSLAATISINAPLSGTYTVIVADSNVNREGSALGDYLLHLVKAPGDLIVPPEDEGGPMINGANHAGRIGAPGAEPTLHRADLDPWTFTAAQNDSIIVTIGEVLDSEVDPEFRPWIRLFGPNGTLLASDAGALAATLSITAPLSGSYTLVVADSNVNRQGSAVGDYLLHLVKTPGTLTIPVGEEGGPMTNGANHAGRIGAPGAKPTLHRADLDPWTFTAAQNDAIIVTIGEVLDSEVDPDFLPWIRLYGPTGVLLTSDAGSLAATLSITAPLSGTYTVVVADSNVNREGAAVGDYLLHLVKTPGTLTIPDGDEGGSMTNGGNHAGRIGAPGAKPALHRADLDPWTFTAAQNDAIIVTIGEVLDSEVDPDFLPWIRLYGPTGVLLGSDAGSLAATLSVTAPLSGNYTVVVADSNVNRQGSEVGDYILHLVKTPGVLTIPAADEGGAMTNATSHAGRIGAPGAKPTLHRADVDPWTFDCGPGRAITLNITETLPAGPDPDFSPWIRLFGPTGTLVASSAGALNASINANTTSTGLYTVVVADSNINRQGAAVGDYVLTALGIDICATAPTSNNDSYSTPRNTSLVITAPGVLSNDSSNGGGPMTAVLVNSVASGTLTLSSNGGFVFTPENGFVGTRTFTYRAQNGSGPGNVATVTINVTAPPPTTLDDTYSVFSGSVLTVSAPGVLSNDNSNGSGALTALLVTSSPNGTLALDATGAFSYTPNTGFVGTDSFVYRAVSSVGPGNTALVTLNVQSTSDPLAPTGLSVLSVVGNTVTIRWAPPTGGATPTNYVLEGGISPGTTLASISTGLAPVYTFQAPNGAFYIRVHTLSGAARSGPSNEVPLFVSVPVAPSAPANLLGLVNGSTLGLAWRNTFGGGAPTGLFLDVSGSASVSIPLGLTDTFVFNGVPPGTYTLSLRAINAAGASASSNAVTLAFPQPCSGPPEPPSNFLAYRVGNTLNVIWDPAAVGTAPTSYVVNVSGSFAASIPTPTRSLSGGVGPGSYSSSVAAVNACGTSAPTAVQTIVVP